MSENENFEQTSVGLKANIAAALCYSIGFVTGVIFLLIEKKNPFVRFHAMQSLMAFGALFVLQAVVSTLMFLYILLPLLSLAGLILWIVLMIKAFQGEKFKLPYVGDLADQKKNAFGAEEQPPEVQ